MKPIIWSKIYWTDWRAEQELQACSLEAKGLWFELLCLAAPRGGYLADGEEPLPVELIAAMVHEPLETVERLMAELEAKRVFKRDAKGCIYAPRLLKDAKLIRAARENGRKGGRACHDKQRGIFVRSTPGSEPVPDSKSQESEVISQKSEVTNRHPTPAGHTAPPASPVAPLIRAAEAMGATLDALHRHPAWMVFGDTFATWVEEGCDPERDIWPTLRARTLKRHGKVPASPAYFTEAVREARDRRGERPAPGSRTIGAPYLASTALSPAAFVTQEQWDERARMFEIHGLWSRRWGPKPGETGSLAPGRGSGIGNQESGIRDQGSA